MRSTGTPMMRATVGFCAVACIWWPIEVRFSSAVRPITTAIASASTPRLCNETTRPRIETSPAGTMEGNGDASALKNCFTASFMPIASAMVAIASGSTPCRSIGSTSSSLKPSPSSSSDSRMPRMIASQNGAPACITASIRNAGSMTNSPCAKLMVCDVCHSSVKPTATRA